MKTKLSTSGILQRNGKSNSLKSILLLVAMLLVATSNAFAEISLETIDGLRYLLHSDEKTAALVASADGKYSGKVIVPEKVKSADGEEYIVTALGDNAFKNCSGLTSVTIPSSVTSLGDNCFGECSSLTSITIPSSVTSLGDNCFFKCSGLTSITISSSVTSLGTWCFGFCKSLTSITIPSSVTSLGDNCFFKCSGLTSITISSSVTSLGTWCFGFCKSLTSITIPSSVTSLGDNCFYNCSGLTSITIPSSVTSLGSYCFSGCSSLISITIPSSVTSLEELCFSGCSSLTSVTIPSTVSSLGQYCFENCSSLTSITIPSSVTSLKNRCFSGCEKLESVFFKGKCPNGTIGSSIPTTCILYVPQECLQDYIDALGSTYSYIYASTGIEHAKTRGVIATSHDGIVTLSGLSNGEEVRFYAVDGKLIGAVKAIDGVASQSVSSASLVIAKIGGQAIKIAVK